MFIVYFIINGFFLVDPYFSEFTDDLIAAQAFSFFIGGYETTSVTMSCIFYELASNEDIQQKLQNEIDSAFPTSAEISYDDLKLLEYLDMVIKGKSGINRNITIKIYSPRLLPLLRI